MAKYFSKDIAVYLGAYEPGTATTRIAIALIAPMLDITAFGDAAERVIPDVRRDTLEWRGVFDDSTLGIDAAMPNLLGTGTGVVASIYFGTATGNVAYSGTGYLLSYRAPGGIGNAVGWEADFQPDNQWRKGVHYGKISGKVFTANGESTQSGSIDNGGTTTGGTLFVHVIGFVQGSASPSFQVQWQDGTDGATFDIMATASGSAAMGTFVLTTTAIRRYTRVRYVQIGAGTSTSTLTAMISRD